MAKSAASRQRRSTLKSFSRCSPDELPSLANRFSLTVSRLRGKRVGNSRCSLFIRLDPFERNPGPSETAKPDRQREKERPWVGASQGRACQVTVSK